MAGAMAFRVLPMMVNQHGITTRTMNINEGRKQTPKGRIVHQVQPISGTTQINILMLIYCRAFGTGISASFSSKCPIIFFVLLGFDDFIVEL
ncbi:hypothetical protein [Serratia fonticola]